MPFDFKKEYKEFYMPPKKPGIVKIPKMNYIAVRGTGDPNSENGEYKESIGLLYAVAFTIKMSKLGSHRMAGYFDYVVPPLEGFWRQEGSDSIDYSLKRNFTSFRQSGFLILLLLMNLTGRSGKLPEKRSLTFPKWSSLLMMKGCACSACISVHMTTSRKR